jgi:Fe-S-cluster containining protein
MTISRHLNITETLCRERYILPSATWNEKDGTLALKDEKCVFLEQGSSGTYKCAIYQVRPLSCREIMPDMERCRKDSGKLLTYVERLEIEPHTLSCHLTTGSCVQIERRNSHMQDALIKLHEVVYPFLGSIQSELDMMTRDAHKILDWLFINYKAGASLDILMPRFHAMKEVVDDFDTLTPLRHKDPRDLELLWSKLRNLQEMFASGRCGDRSSRSGDEEVNERKADSSEEMPVAISFQPTALSIEMKLQDRPAVTTLHYENHGKLLGLVRTFLEALVTSREPGLVDVLSHSDPYCFQCGVCCGSYDLEITTVDIERIADYLKISEKELREKYLEPGRRSWNRKDGLIRKISKEGNEERCIFLEVRGPTESECRIYSARSRMCRDYPANTRLCRKKSLVLKGHEHIGYIISCHVVDDMIRLTTDLTNAHKREPFVMALKDHDTLRELFYKVRAEILQIIENSNYRL